MIASNTIQPFRARHVFGIFAAMLSGSNIGVEQNGVPLFRNATFRLNVGERAGLSGRNGAGKSTLLRIMTGERKPDEGTLSINPGTQVAYLPQEIHRKSNCTVLEEVLSAFGEIRQMEARAEEIAELLQHPMADEKIFELTTELHDLHERLSVFSGNEEKEAELILTGLGFERSEFSKPVETFSGGWRMRIELARLLLKNPDLLLLDEPTNHLDIEAIRWLETFLQQFRGGIVLVSHDKTFLDKLCTHTWEITPAKLYVLSGNYSRFREWKSTLISQQKAERKNQEKYVQHTQNLINKFRAKSSKAAFAQSLINKLEKFELTEVDEEDFTQLSFRFPPAPPSGKMVLEAEDIAKSYGEKLIFSDVSFALGRGEKIALVGKNGEGKTTFTKILTGETDFEGKLRFGHNVKVGYFAQDQHLRLNPALTVFDTVDELAQGDIRTRLRDMLGIFLFSGDDINKKVGVLSGGEKSRLALCCMMLEPCNLLILDEPTHHLDIPSTEMLKRALEIFDGTMIIVSHDRDFLSGLTNKVFEFRNQRVRQLHGDIGEYLHLRELEETEDAMNSLRKAKSKEQKSTEEAVKPKEKEVKKENTKNKSRLLKLESEIEKLESEIRDTEVALSDPDSFKKDPGLLDRYQKIKEELDKKMTEWEKLAE